MNSSMYFDIVFDNVHSDKAVEDLFQVAEHDATHVQILNKSKL